LKIDGKIIAVASIFPLADIIQQIGGERIEVDCLLPPGRSPHGYEPTPKQAETLARADLFFRVGSGLDIWADKSMKASGNTNLTSLVMCGTTAEEEKPCPCESHNHDPSCSSISDQKDKMERAGDPHVWLDPIFVHGFVDKAAHVLISVDPAGAAIYKENAKAFKNALKELDEQYKAELAPLVRREFLSFHYAFTHLAKRYGLVQIALTDPGVDESGPGRLEKAVSYIRSHDIVVVFVEPQYPARDIETLARETEVKIGCLDPLGNPALKGRQTYLELMKSNLAALKKGLSD